MQREPEHRSAGPWRRRAGSPAVAMVGLALAVACASTEDVLLQDGRHRGGAPAPDAGGSGAGRNGAGTSGADPGSFPPGGASGSSGTGGSGATGGSAGLGSGDAEALDGDDAASGSAPDAGSSPDGAEVDGGGMDAGGGSADAGGGSADAGGGSADAGGGSADAGGGSADAGGGSADAGTGAGPCHNATNGAACAGGYCANGECRACVSTPSCTCETNAGSTYLFCTDQKSWVNAQARCREDGMHLVRIDSDAENTWVRQQVSNKSMGEAWIGANDRAVEGEWRWPDGTLFWLGDQNGAPQAGLFNNWADGEPNDLFGNEDCASFGDFGDWQWQWFDRNCNDNRRYVCKAY